MKRKITYAFIALGIIASIVVLIIGIKSDNFLPSLRASLITLFATAVFAVILIALCEISENTEKTNAILSKIRKSLDDTEEKQLQARVDARFNTRKDINEPAYKAPEHHGIKKYEKTRCRECVYNVNQTRCEVYEKKPFDAMCEYCYYFKPIEESSIKSAEFDDN